MARLPIDVIAQLETHRQSIEKTAKLVARSTELHAEVQRQIEASVALVKRAKGLKWLTNAPTLPKWIDTLPRRKSTFENKND